ncbi:MAG: LPXTG cell wall anchor domain-containing protein [Chloroflexi bacterium]|nr:LPXTG cell wall anchor domain-containing protein [Chloroflexota bacterium]
MPTDPEPATSATDVVIPLAALAALVAAFAVYFLRRRRE